MKHTDPQTQKAKASSPTHHAPRNTQHAARRLGFTLIEMLIVVAIMATLAALTIPVLSAVKKQTIRTRARGDLTQIETAIEAYQAKFGHYPPDNGGWYSTNQLYYELLGTTNVPASTPYFQTLDGSAKLNVSDVPIAFVNVSGFVNCNQPGNGDEAPPAISFIREGGIKANQFVTTSINGKTCNLLGVALDGPYAFTTATGQKISPWWYNSSNPTNNPKTFDLWVDVYVGGQTNRISNWSTTPQVIYKLYGQ